MAVTIELLKALGALWWPLAIVILGLVFRKDLSGLLGRVRKAKGLGIEIDAAAEELKAATDKIEPPHPGLIAKPEPPQLAAPKVASMSGSAAGSSTATGTLTAKTQLQPPTAPSPRRVEWIGTAAPKATTDPSWLARKVLELDKDAPISAVMRLTRRIERALIDIIATAGLWEQVGHRSLDQLDELITVFADVGGSKSLIEPLERFAQVRSAIVHAPGPPATHAATIAIDSGLRILGALETFPIEWHIVNHADVAIFADEKCTKLRQGVFAVVLERSAQTAFPTRLHHFAKGMRVSWEWDKSGPAIGESWYRDPDTNEIMHGWTGSLEFVGRSLDSLSALC